MIFVGPTRPPSKRCTVAFCRLYVSSSLFSRSSHIKLGDEEPDEDTDDATTDTAARGVVNVGGAAGALMAFALYSITVISLPMLIDQDVDFITAMIASMKTVQANTFVMLVWAALMSVLLFLSMAPLFLGLLVVLPVLAHATWHLYRRAIPVAPAVA